MEGMHAAFLADPIDASNALLEPHRIPRQLEVDDRTAAFVQIEPLAGGIGGQEHAAAAAREPLELDPTLLPRHAPMEHGAVARQAPTYMEQGVAVLGEHDGLLAEPSEPSEQPLEQDELRFACAGRNRACGDDLQQPALAAGIAQDRRELGRLVARVELSGIGQRQQQLPAAIWITGMHRRESSSDRLRQGVRARERAFLEHGDRQPCVARRLRVGGDGGGQIGDRRVHFTFGRTGRDQDAVHAPAAAQRDLLPASAKDQQAVAGLGADAAERVECGPAPAVRGRGEQRHIRRPAADGADGVEPVAAGPGAVGFIHDDEVPSAGDQRRLHLGALDVVERRDRDGAPSSMD